MQRKPHVMGIARRDMRYSVAAGSWASQHGGRGAQAAIVVDHPESAHQRMLRAGYLPPLGFSQQLPHRLHQAEIASGCARLSHRQLAAAGVVRQAALDRKIVAANEAWRFALCEK